MKKKIIFGLLSFFLIFSLLGCKKDKDPDKNPPDDDNPPIVDPEKPEYPFTNLDDGKAKTARNLRIYDHGNDTIYFGDTFTAEGYEVFMQFEETELMLEGGSQYSLYKLETFTIDDSKVNYYKEGTYTVNITGRVREVAFTSTIFINVKADRYESLGVKHLMGIKCNSYMTVPVGSTKDAVTPDGVYLIYTENKYENNELVLIEERIRSGYTVTGLDDIDFSKAGKYPVYVSFSETYGEVKIEVKTFFTLTIE
ncbi:MAG: hypothetical protein K2I42_00200 [Anaeroplasmataceae bacterium]|nr:hypothetical protein [Anaeroplasmataceae bacterium]